MSRIKWRRGSIILITLLFVMQAGVLMNAVSPQERSALITFYNATGGDGWKNNSGWKTPPLDTDGFAMPGTEGTWKGITVVMVNDEEHVKFIALANNNLVGTIPQEMGNLTILSSLQLGTNKLTGSIPDALGNLGNLQYIYLNNNQLSGTIPQTLGNLTQLKYLFLDKNQLTGNIPATIGNLANMEKLYLQTNQLTGEVPEELGNLGNLKELQLNGNQLSGVIPAGLGSLSQLKTLHLAENQFTGTIPPALGNLVNLENLYLYDNQLTGDIPQELGTLTALKIIHLGENQLTGGIPTWLASHTNLVRIQIYDNQLTGAIPVELGTLGNLERLDLSNNQLTGTIPAELGNLVKLQYLLLSENRLTGTIPATLGNLRQLESLALKTNRLSGEIPVELGNQVNLINLNLAYNLFTGSIPTELGNLVKLRYLMMNNNELGGEIPVELMNLVELVYLDLCYNSLYATDSDLRAWLDAKQSGWEECQNETTPTITVTSPNGGETWEVGSDQFVTWETEGTVLEVKIEYSVDGGDNWMIIEQVMENIHSYAWVVPDRDSSNCRVRISDVSDAAVTDESDGPFTIIPSKLTVTSPNGGDVLEPCSTHNITWTSEGAVDDVKIEYSTDNGSTWESIIATTPDNGTYSWTVPETASTSCLLRISDAADGTPQDISDGVFTIEPSAITLTSPNGGQIWQVGLTYPITWTSTGCVENVKIEYSTNNGGTWTTITSSAPESGTYDWTIPNENSTSCLVRVSDAAEGEPQDVSNAVFEIFPPTITVISPNGGEIWGSCSTHYITWTSTGTVGPVKIEYTTNNGASWTTIANSTANDGYVYWTSPNTETENFRVRVSDASGGFPSDMSDSTVTLERPTITVTFPNGGEEWEAGSVQNITWTTTGPVPQVTIQYSTDNGSSWANIANSTADDGVYSWQVPSTVSTGYLVKVSSGCIYDISNSFTVGNPSITVTSPNGGENLIGGTKHNITWNSLCVETVNIYHYFNPAQGWQLIGSSSAKPGTYEWQVPETCSSTSLVKVEDASNAAVWDQSDAVFNIDHPTLTLTSPNGGEVLNSGITHNITWTSECIESVTLEYSIDNGLTWLPIGTVSAEPGVHAWNVPDECSTVSLVRIQDASDAAVVDQSDAVFKINHPTLNILELKEGTIFDCGVPIAITWESECVENVKIEYSNNNGITWTTLQSLFPAVTGSYTWTPLSTCASYRIRVSDTQDVTAKDEVNVSVDCPSVAITSPSEGTVYDCGAQIPISWNSDCIENVNIEYSADNGNTWNILQSSVSAGDGNYTWASPPSTCSSYRIRVSDIMGGTVKDEVNVSMNCPSLTIESPTEGTVFECGEQIPIAWTSDCVEQVNIEYSTDNGSTWNIIQSSFSDSTKSYSWTPPSTCSSYKIRVSDAQDATVNDEVNVSVECPSLALTSPSEGTVFQCDDSIIIGWTSDCVKNVSIQYSNNGGSTWNTLESSFSAEVGTYSWTPPSTCSSYTIRVSDTQDGTVKDEVNVSVDCPSLALTSPSEGTVFQCDDSIIIGWTSDCVENVSIQYSNNGGSTWNTLESSFSAEVGTYSWTPPSTCSSYTIRVSDTQDGTVKDEVNVSVDCPSLTITSPSGGTVFDCGETITIGWGSDCVDNVRIQYSNNGGSTWNTLDSSISAEVGTYSWTPPSTCSSYTIRISDTQDGTVKDEVNVSVDCPSTELISPNGGEVLYSGCIYPISWGSVECVTNVNIEYTTGDGTWHSIASQVPANTGTYTWNIADTPSTTCLVRISDADDGSALDTSDSTFTIVSSELTITSPTGNDDFYPGCTYPINWTSTGCISENVPNVKLLYRPDNYSEWVTITDSTPNDGNFDWTIPELAPQSFPLLVIADASDGTLLDFVLLIIVAPRITITAPNGGEVFPCATPINVTWASTGCVENVKLEYSSDNGQNWFPIVESTPNTGSYVWGLSSKLIPKLSSTECLVRVSDASDGAVVDMSDATFTIDCSTITVTAPNGGEVLHGGSSQIITWTSTGIVENVKIEYDLGNGWQVYADSTENDGSFKWTVPDVSATSCRVKVSDAADGNPSDVSSAAFTIVTGTITVTSPSGGESVYTSSNYLIRWFRSSDIANVKIEFTTLGDPHWQTIIDSTPNDGYFSWAVPPSYLILSPASDPTAQGNILSSICRVRISNADGGIPSDISEGTFTLYDSSGDGSGGLQEYNEEKP